MKVGEKYTIQYDAKGTPAQKKNFSYVALTEETVSQMQQDLKKSTKTIKEIYALHKKQWQPYIKATKELQTIREKRDKFARKSAKEKALEVTINKLKKELFIKKTIDCPRSKAINMFMRALDMDRITEVEGGMEVIYGGKWLTHTGKTVHRFYLIEFQKVENSYLNGLDEDIKNYLVIRGHANAT